jgi:UDP-N-acetylmuramyl pentapeptide synthase
MRLIGDPENRPKSLAAVYSAEEIIELTGARVAVGMVPDEVGEIATDTRSDLTGSWFVALVGKTFDGHDFIGVSCNLVGGGGAAGSGADVPSRTFRGVWSGR